VARDEEREEHDGPRSLPLGDIEDEEDDNNNTGLSSFTGWRAKSFFFFFFFFFFFSLTLFHKAPRHLLEALPEDSTAAKGDVFDEYRGKNIAERENDYQKRRLNRQLSPDRVDAFSAKDQKGRRTYKEAMEEVILDREVRLHFALCFVVFLMCLCVCV
jgi:hypothetical protein